MEITKKKGSIVTPRERIKTLMKHKIPDHMGIYEHFWRNSWDGKWLDQGYPKGVVPDVYFDFDMLMCGGGLEYEPFAGHEEIMEETDKYIVSKNGFGATTKKWKSGYGTPEHLSFELITPDIWKKYRPALLDVSRSRLKDLEKQKEKFTSARKDQKYVFFASLFVFELMRCGMGDENFLPAMALEPEWIKDFCQVYLDFFRNHYEMLFKETGVPDGFMIYEDFAYSKGLYCSPAMLKELIFPYEKQLMDFLHDYGIDVILHCCGNMREAIPSFLDMGIDCLQAMEAKAGCDIVDIAGRYGNKLCYMGNIDIRALCSHDEQTVKDEIIPKLLYLKENRIPYVFHSDHSIPGEISLVEYRRILEIVKDNYAYGKTGINA